jgi:hypothetical protein
MGGMMITDFTITAETAEALEAGLQDLRKTMQGRSFDLIASAPEIIWKKPPVMRLGKNGLPTPQSKGAICSTIYRAALRINDAGGYPVATKGLTIAPRKSGDFGFAVPDFQTTSSRA